MWLANHFDLWLILLVTAQLWIWSLKRWFGTRRPRLARAYFVDMTASSLSLVLPLVCQLAAVQCIGVPALIISTPNSSRPSVWSNYGVWAVHSRSCDIHFTFIELLCKYVHRSASGFFSLSLTLILVRIYRHTSAARSSPRHRSGTLYHLRLGAYTLLGPFSHIFRIVQNNDPHFLLA